MIGRARVGKESLAGLHQDELSLVPEALAGKVPAGEVFREHERRRGNPLSLLPFPDPISGLFRILDRARPHRAETGAHTTPDDGASRQATKQATDLRQVGYGICYGNGNAPRVEERRQATFVLAQLDDGSPREEQATGDLSSKP